MCAALTTIVSNLLFDDTDLLVVVVAAPACVACSASAGPAKGWRDCCSSWFRSSVCW